MRLLILGLLTLFGLHAKDRQMSFYEFSAQTLQGEMKQMSDYKGKVVLVVNTASKCGFTPQYEGLEKLYKSYKDQGLEILGFPCNQFGNQEPGSEKEIETFCTVNYGVTFQMFDKIDVNGKDTHPLYVFLKDEQRGFLGSKNIKWNFTKFLIDREGNVVKRFGSAEKPASIEKDIQKLL